MNNHWGGTYNYSGPRNKRLLGIIGLLLWWVALLLLLLRRRVALLLLLGVALGISRRLPRVALLLNRWVVLLLPRVARLLLWRVTTTLLLLLLLWEAWVEWRVVAHYQL